MYKVSGNADNDKHSFHVIRGAIVRIALLPSVKSRCTAALRPGPGTRPSRSTGNPSLASSPSLLFTFHNHHYVFVFHQQSAVKFSFQGAAASHGSASTTSASGSNKANTIIATPRAIYISIVLFKEMVKDIKACRTFL